MKEHVRLRAAVREDAPELAALWLEFMAFHAGRDELLGLSENAEEHWMMWITGKIESDDSLVAVAESRGHICGYCVATIKQRPPVFQRRDYVEVMELAVTASARGGGIGSRLYDYTAAWIKERGVDWVWLEVAATNDLATAFWENKGYRRFLETYQRGI